MFYPGPIFFIRHGQTDWNAEGRFQGQHDIPLNDRGRAQARQNGLYLAHLLANNAAAFDYVASPLGRTRETMELLRGAMQLDPSAYSTDERLIELSFGAWEGQTLEELEEGYPDAMKRREGDKWHFQPPGDDAESYEILSWRIAGWLDSVTVPTICVTHGGVIRALLKLTGAATAREAASTDIHQDRIMKLENGRLGWIA